MTHRSRQLLLSLALFASPTAVMAQDHPPGPPPKAVHVADAREETLQARRQVTGELRSVARSNVATYEEGIVTELPARAGTRFRAGEVVAVIDARRLELAIKRLQAQLAVADARIENRRAELKMREADLVALIELSAQRATNPKELSDARLLADAAKALEREEEQERAVMSAEAELLETRLEGSRIKAPFDGVVVRPLTEVGQWIGSGDAVAEFVSRGAYEVWLDVPQRLAPTFAGQAPVNLQVHIDAMDERATLTGVIVVPRVDSKARSFQVYATIPDARDRFKPGMSVTGWVPTGTVGTYVTIPRDALVRGQVGFFVYVASTPAEGPAALATPVPVTILFDVKDRVAVTSERLRPGDEVVVEGNERLFPMMPITPVRSTPGRLGTAEPPPTPAAGSGS